MKKERRWINEQLYTMKSFLNKEKEENENNNQKAGIIIILICILAIN